MTFAIKKSVAVAIHDRAGLLIVQRPADDEDLPGAWGLPAASLQPEEAWAEAVRRAGRDKLGVELAVGRQLRRGALQRRAYLLEMRLYEARIVTGTLRVPQPDRSVTQYQGWKWGSVRDLNSGAERGSLCCQLYIDWNVSR